MRQRPRILNAEPDGFAPEATAILREVGDLHEETCDRSRLAELLPEFEILVLRFGVRIDADMLARAPRLQIIGCPATGTDHIDTAAAEAQGVKTVSLNGDRAFLEGLTATAELAWGLLLAVVRRLPQAIEHVRGGGWNRDAFQGLQLRGKTLGIVGFGRLGRRVAAYGRAFGMPVLACDPYVDVPAAEARQTDLETLLAQSDIVSVHVPLTPETRGLLSETALSSMAPGAILINTARGEVVDEEALLAALDAGRLAGAGLDVLAGEGLKPPDWPRCNPVWMRAQRDPRLALTPHIGGKTAESNRDADVRLVRKLVVIWDAENP